MLVLSLAALLGFLVGTHHQSQPGMTILHGRAYVGIDQASVTVHGWVYGIQGTGNLTWVDSQGSVHSTGWPSCLHGPGYAPITFGEVPITTAGISSRQVVWVNCQ